MSKPPETKKTSALLDNLNAEQESAVKHTSGPLLIVAGAGTGKTTVVTRKIAYFIEQGLAKPDEILALTFTDKAAGEMQERVDLLLPLGYNDLWISTFHSFCQRVLEQHGLDIGLPGDFKILSETRQWILVHNNLDKFQLEYYRPLGNPKKFITSLVKHFSKCKDELITPGEYLEHARQLQLNLKGKEKANTAASKTQRKSRGKKTDAANAGFPVAILDAEAVKSGPVEDEAEIMRLLEVAGAYHTYQKLLLDNNCLDFADLINYTLELFKKRPKILSYYQNKFKFLLVDEFQDTNYAQYQLIKMLAETSGNLTVVGDDDQSIYKFRGASVSNILKFQEDYPKLRQITLVENYRSSQEILDLAYRFIQANNPDRLEVKLNISKRLKSQSGEPAVIEVLEGKDLSDELNSVAKKIVELKNKPLTAASQPGPSWNDFAVLIRSNSAAEELLPALSAHGIPHTFVASTGLYKTPLISNLIAYMKLLDNFHDSFSLYRALNFAGIGLKPDKLASLLAVSAKKTLSLYETLQNADSLAGLDSAAREGIKKFLHALHSHAAMAQNRAANEVFVDLVSALGLPQKLEAETLENAEARELLEQFYKKIEAFVQENADKSMHYFLHLLDLEMEAGDEGHIKFDPNLGPESLKVLTVHAAKGLEFEYVFIINLVDQRFPTRPRKDSIEIPSALIKDILPEGDFHIQEERRLFYVSLTRAKRGLFLAWSKDYGGKTLKKPSQFLTETALVPSEKVSAATGKVVFSKPVKAPVPHLELPKTYSFTAIKTFKTCPLEYKYKYYLKFPAKGSHYFSFGQTIHLTLENFMRDYLNKLNTRQQDLFSGQQGTAEIGAFDWLEKLYHQAWIDEWYLSKAQKENYRKKGLKMLKTFYEETLKNMPRPKYIEKSFRLKLDKFIFTGKIDRADELPGGGIKILDYKTGEKVPSKTDKEDLDQLYIYQWAAQEHLNEKVGDMAYWYLDENRLIHEEVAPDEKIQNLKSSLLETIEKINHTIKHDLFMEEHKKLRDHDCQYLCLE